MLNLLIEFQIVFVMSYISNEFVNLSQNVNILFHLINWYVIVTQYAVYILKFNRITSLTFFFLELYVFIRVYIYNHIFAMKN